MPTSSSADGNVLADIAPGAVRRIHLVGVAGTGMGAFAGMLRAAGYHVTGSDENVYPPMSDMLREWGIEVFTPYGAANLDRARPDLVIIGNVIRRVNPEATAVRERGLSQMSFPAAFGALIAAGRHSIVITGTHGKTTTAALMGHVLAEAGLDPTFLVGGVTLNYHGNFRLGSGPHVVVEGDEYDTAYFDKGPKFLHYRARTALLTSVEFDHADIYTDLAHYESSFQRFCATLPADGWLGVSASYPRAVALARAHTRAQVVTYAADAPADYRAAELRFSEAGAHFAIEGPGGERVPVLLPMSGSHNVENAVGLYAAARSLGLSSAQIAAGFASFLGVKRRQEPRGEVGGVLVLDDFAHHPTAVRQTVAGIRQRYQGRRLWAVFEPRSNTSRRNIHQADYAAAFDDADVVLLRRPEPHDQVPADQQLDVDAVVDAIRARGIEANALAEVPELVERIAREAQPGDLVLVMSNGAFGGLIPSLLAALEQPPEAAKEDLMAQPQSVSVDTLKAIAAAFNAHDLDAIMEFFSDDCSFDMPRGPEPWGQRFTGKAAVREGLATRFKGLPDVHYGDDRHWVSGDRGVSEWLLTGTAPDGRPVRVRGCDLWEFRDGKVIRKDSYWKIVEGPA